MSMRLPHQPRARLRFGVPIAAAGVVVLCVVAVLRQPPAIAAQSARGIPRLALRDAEAATDQRNAGCWRMTVRYDHDAQRPGEPWLVHEGQAPGSGYELHWLPRQLGLVVLRVDAERQARVMGSVRLPRMPDEIQIARRGARISVSADARVVLDAIDADPPSAPDWWGFQTSATRDEVGLTLHIDRHLSADDPAVLPLAVDAVATRRALAEAQAGWEQDPGRDPRARAAALALAQQHHAAAAVREAWAGVREAVRGRSDAGQALASALAAIGRGQSAVAGLQGSRADRAGFLAWLVLAEARLMCDRASLIPSALEQSEAVWQLLRGLPPEPVLLAPELYGAERAAVLIDQLQAVLPEAGPLAAGMCLELLPVLIERATAAPAPFAAGEQILVRARALRSDEARRLQQETLGMELLRQSLDAAGDPTRVVAERCAWFELAARVIALAEPVCSDLDGDDRALLALLGHGVDAALRRAHRATPARAPDWLSQRWRLLGGADPGAGSLAPVPAPLFTQRRPLAPLADSLIAALGADRVASSGLAARVRDALRTPGKAGIDAASLAIDRSDHVPAPVPTLMRGLLALEAQRRSMQSTDADERAPLSDAAVRLARESVRRLEPRDAPQDGSMTWTGQHPVAYALVRLLESKQRFPGLTADTGLRGGLDPALRSPARVPVLGDLPKALEPYARLLVPSPTGTDAARLIWFQNPQVLHPAEALFCVLATREAAGARADWALLDLLPAFSLPLELAHPAHGSSDPDRVPTLSP